MPQSRHQGCPASLLLRQKPAPQLPGRALVPGDHKHREPRIGPSTSVRPGNPAAARLPVLGAAEQAPPLLLDLLQHGLKEGPLGRHLQHWRHRLCEPRAVLKALLLCGGRPLLGKRKDPLLGTLKEAVGGGKEQPQAARALACSQSLKIAQKGHWVKSQAEVRQLPKRLQIIHQLLGFPADSIPHWVQLPPHNLVKALGKGVVARQVGAVDAVRFVQLLDAALYHCD
mmetsp:Transcript_873/g.2641  ORF Transcript_873/g.2641 Transcript_873/m.2641 type:complete len:227 (+) Transcript_873:216-896(+)